MIQRPRTLAVASPLFIGLLSILSLFEKNPGETWFIDFLFLSFFLMILVISVIAIFFSLKRCLLQSSLSTFLVFLPLSIINESHSYFTNVLVWLSSALTALIFLFSPIKITVLKKIQQIIFFPLCILIIFFGTCISISKIRIFVARKNLENKLNSQFVELKRTQNPTTHLSPDVYFIILDEFISPIAFKNYYQYNNTGFFSFLEASGFHLVNHPYSNYAWTIPSISSMVSLNYHKNWVSKKEFPKIAHFLLRYNMIAKLLQSEGYQIYTIPSIYWLGNSFKKIWKDFLFRSKSYGLTMSVLRSTPLAKKARKYQRIEHRNHILNQFTQFEKVVKKKEKKFVFTHLLCPHRPIVFDREGKNLKEEHIVLAEQDKNHKYYLDQAYFISCSIQKLVKTILASSTIPPFIIIVSDHGKFPIGVSGKGKITLPISELSWRLSNFIALHLPNHSSEIPQLFTAVNVFRLLLNDYYGYNLPLLQDICHTDFFDLEKGEDPMFLIPFQYGRSLQ